MYKNLMIPSDCTVKDAIKALDDNRTNVLFVCDDKGVLKGLFTQGDMRRYVLKSTDLSPNISAAMNPNPIVFDSIEGIHAYREDGRLIVYPIVDKNGVLVDAVFDRPSSISDTHISDELKEVPLVIMAGGKGTRLYPYTKVLPKALIPIGDYTISERIIRQFSKYGCRDVFFVLNHKAEMIKAYFNDMKKDYHVEYVIEKEFLGTGGGLCLLKDKIHSTFFLSNCDILINDDMECIYKSHKMNKNKITFVCAMKNIVIPYGVVDVDEYGGITSLREKPEFSFFTNTGVYVIEPEVIDELKEGEFIHLPDIAQRYIEKGERVGVFPISEQAWMDMGQFSEMERMVKSLENE